MTARKRPLRLREKLARMFQFRKQVAEIENTRKCHFEAMEPRYMLAADPLNVGAVYIEEDLGSDLQGDTFEITFNGGAPDSQLTRLEVNGDQRTPGFGPGDAFFDTASTGFGHDNAIPFTLVSFTSQDPNATVQASVADGQSLLVLDLSGFRAGDKLVFEIDVDEVELFDPIETDLEVINDGFDSITSGVEFHGSTFTTYFSAPHFEDVSGQTTFVNRYDDQLSGTGLDLPADNARDNRDRTTGTAFQLEQTPKPISISGTVYLDNSLNLQQDANEPGIAGVELSLFTQVGNEFQFTAATTTTDANGDYEFGLDLNLPPGVYQIRETQPDGLFSVGAVVGTVDASPSGELVASDPDTLTEISIPLGDTHGVNYDFAEAHPACISGFVFSDLNDNGIRDANEPGIAGATIAVIPVSTIASQDPVLLTANSDGYYEACDLSPGTYRVVETSQPEGFFDGTDSPGTVNGIPVGVAANPGDSIENIVLTGGSTGVEYNFGEILPAWIHGNVHLSTADGDCFGENEQHTPVPNVTVQLFDASGNFIAETLTDEQGIYRFEGLEPGEYSVVEITPDGLFDGAEHVGDVNGTTVGAVSGNDRISKIVLGPDHHGENYDFCEHLPSSISGFVYHDENNDGVFDNNELPIDGATVVLLDQNGVQVAQAVTAADGSYRFENLPAGNYTLNEIQLAGFFDGLDTAGTISDTIVGSATNPGDAISEITIGWGEHGVEYNFGELLGAEISGFVHSDPNENCQFEDGEDPISAVRVDLLDSQGNLVSSTFTDSSGKYSFSNLRPGQYSVVEHQPDSFFDGGQVAGTTGGDATLANLIQNINVGSNETSRLNNFCELPPSSISGFVYQDASDDGNFDANELPIAGATVRLLDQNGNVVQQTISQSDGSYRFENLRAGNYRIAETQPGGFFDGQDTAGSINGNVVGSPNNPGDAISNVTIGWGEQGINYNFGELLPASISGFVHSDPNRNCQFEEGESPISNVQIDLLDDNGNLVATTFTDSQGQYEFENLRPGQYSIVEHSADGYFDGGQVAGTTGGDASQQNRIGAIVVGSGEASIQNNFCEVPPGSISGFVHVDPNRNCIFEEGEDGIAGVRIDLFDNAGNHVATTVTDLQGHYQFTGLAPGQYSIREHQPDGFFNGSQVAGSSGGDASQADLIQGITVLPDEMSGNNNFCEVPPGSISGFVHVDPNRNCIFEEGEDGIAGVRIDLLDSAGNHIVTTVTDVSGHYQFTGLAPGQYSIREHQPDGFFNGSQVAGSFGGDASQADLIQGITVLPDATSANNNFCEQPPSSISGFVHVDPNRDCQIDEGEERLSGVTIHLLDSQGTIVATTQTNTAGFYEFSGLRPGVYSIQEIQPANFFDGDRISGSVNNDDLLATPDLSTLGNIGNQVLGGQLGGGLVNVPSSQVPTNDPNIVSNISVGAGETLVNYNFCEVPASSISGVVFQDGDAIQTEDGQAPENIRAYRDGLFTPDDVPIAGVVVELRDGILGTVITSDQALPGYYPDGPIRTTTDENGFYEFVGLPSGNYAVYQVHPDGFIDSIDTPGTTSGIAINPSDNVNPQILLRLTNEPKNDAIILIPLGVGQRSDENNFSEIQVTRTPIIPPPPETPPPVPGVEVTPEIFARPVPAPVIEIPVAAPRVEFIVGGGAMDYTWHLSIVDAGTPRGDGLASFNSMERFHTASFLTRDQWHFEQMLAGLWLFHSAAEDEDELREIRFGISNAIPVTGDFDGDGLTEVGVFIDGQWFLDLNGNGRWDDEDLWARLGAADDLPVTGDWDGDGKDDIGIFGPEWIGDLRAIEKEPGLPDPLNVLKLQPKNIPPKHDEATDGQRLLKRTVEGRPRADVIDHVFQFGAGHDIPVAGDWNGDGINSIGIFRDGKWHLDIDADGRWSEADVVEHFGKPGDIPVVGDFDGNGVDDIGIFRAGQWQVDINGNGKFDAHDKVFAMGNAGDQPVVGDWDGDGVDEPGLYRNLNPNSDNVVQPDND